MELPEVSFRLSHYSNFRIPAAFCSLGVGYSVKYLPLRGVAKKMGCYAEKKTFYSLSWKKVELLLLSLSEEMKVFF